MQKDLPYEFNRMVRFRLMYFLLLSLLCCVWYRIISECIHICNNFSSFHASISPTSKIHHQKTRDEPGLWPGMRITRIVIHDDVIKWKHFPWYWPFVRGIHRSPVNSPHKGQRRGALMFSLICAWINRWVNSGAAGYLRRYRAHYEVIV